MAGYHAIDPTLPGRIVGMAETEQRNRHSRFLHENWSPILLAAILSVCGAVATALDKDILAGGLYFTVFADVVSGIVAYWKNRALDIERSKPAG